MQWIKNDQNSVTYTTVSPSSVNAYLASLSEFVLHHGIEKYFFQNENISKTSILNMANDLIRMLRSNQTKKMDVAKEIVITYKQIIGKALTTEEQEYEASDREIDVVGEILNGIRYSTFGLIGKSFFSSIFNTMHQGLYAHIPAIVGCGGAVLYGPALIQSVVESRLSTWSLNAGEKDFLRPWLNAVGRLAIGFMPRVHATQAGVHYHYPSNLGHTETYARNQFVSRVGEDITYKNAGKFSTPEGDYAAEYSAQFKLHHIDHLSQQSIRIQMVNQAGEITPVEFDFVTGEYGPEIRISSPNSTLAAHWERYFIDPINQRHSREITKASALQSRLSYIAETSLARINDVMNAGMAHIRYLGTSALLATLVQKDKKFFAMGLMLINDITGVSALTKKHSAKTQCLMSTCISLYQNEDFLRANTLCREALSAGLDTAELYYYLGQIATKLGQYEDAYRNFNRVIAIDSAYLGGGKAFNATRKIFDDFYMNARYTEHQSYNLTTDKESIEYCNTHYVGRNQFFNELHINTIQPVEYFMMCFLAPHLDPFTYDFIGVNYTLDTNWLEDRGWVKGEVMPRDYTDNDGAAYSAVAFLNKEKHRIVIVHRSNVWLLCSLWHVDTKFFIDNGFYHHLNLARSFVKSISTKYPDYYVSHTGFHIGASIAESIACENESIANTVSSPGYLLSRDRALSCNAHIVTYVGNQNFINTLADHIGSMRHVDSILPDFYDFFSLCCVKFKGHLTNKSHVAYSYHVINSRFLEIFFKMNQCTGYAHAAYTVAEWKTNPLKKARGLSFFDSPVFAFTQEDKAMLMSQNINMDELQFDFQRQWVHERLGIEHFSIRARIFLRQYLDNGLYPSNINPRVLKLYYMTDDHEIVVRSDANKDIMIFSILDFQDYIETKLYEALVSRIEWTKDRHSIRDTSEMVQLCNKFENINDGNAKFEL
ncbi:MAG: tetratricopeptide repeat protein [Pseudomonadota bacterium]|nr:tetratricopeptide repeat protein [Pseudomonadota bacterium]